MTDADEEIRQLKERLWKAIKAIETIAGGQWNKPGQKRMSAREYAAKVLKELV